MITRSLGVLGFVLGAALLVVALALLGRAPGLPAETRHLRAMKDRVDEPTRLRDFRMADFAALPHGAPFAERAALERHAVRMEGWVQRMLLSGDGDLHLELAEHRRAEHDRDSVYVVAEITPQWRYPRPAWDYDSLLVAFRPNRGGATRWNTGPARVRISGWLLYDHPYDKRVNDWMLHRESVRLTGWEIHPVTNIECWDDESLSWRELAP